MLEVSWLATLDAGADIPVAETGVTVPFQASGTHAGPRSVDSERILSRTILRSPTRQLHTQLFGPKSTQTATLVRRRLLGVSNFLALLQALALTYTVTLPAGVI